MRAWLKRHPFFRGVLTAIAAFCLWKAVKGFSLGGGQFETSPSGKLRLSIWAPLNPVAGGTYDIDLDEITTEKRLRTLKVTVGSHEQTKSVRSNRVSIVWDPAESYGDIAVDKDFSIRVFVPE